MPNFSRAIFVAFGQRTFPEQQGPLLYQSFLYSVRPCFMTEKFALAQFLAVQLTILSMICVVHKTKAIIISEAISLMKAFPLAVCCPSSIEYLGLAHFGSKQGHLPFESPKVDRHPLREVPRCPMLRQQRCTLIRRRHICCRAKHR